VQPSAICIAGFLLQVVPRDPKRPIHKSVTGDE
jgi:hypothetical protein